MTRPECWLARFSDRPCDGQLVRAHLIPAQKIRRELSMRRVSALDAHRVVWDPRVWVPACGGPMGNAGHHGMLDGFHDRLVVPRSALPVALEEFAAEHGFVWWLDRRYGQRQEA